MAKNKIIYLAGKCNGLSITEQNLWRVHIKNIFDEEELDINSTVKEFLTVQKEENRKVERKVKYYNLDMILSLGYRIKSKVATNFRSVDYY